MDLGRNCYQLGYSHCYGLCSSVYSCRKSMDSICCRSLYQSQGFFHWECSSKHRYRCSDSCIAYQARVQATYNSFSEDSTCGYIFAWKLVSLNISKSSENETNIDLLVLYSPQSIDLVLSFNLTHRTLHVSVLLLFRMKEKTN